MPLPNNVLRPILCYVTDRRSLANTSEGGASRAVLQVIEAAAKAGVDWIQIREKDLSGREVASLTREAVQRAAKSAANPRSPARIFVNDRFDVALAEGAGGVHLGERGLPVKQVKLLLITPHVAQRVSNDFQVGASCHSRESAIAATADGADYLFFGPVFATPSKAAFGDPQGLERLASVCSSAPIPVLAIGGITLENAASCLAAGACGIAAIRLFQDARDMAAVVDALRTASLR